jgi:hypothetical protein
VERFGFNVSPIPGGSASNERWGAFVTVSAGFVGRRSGSECFQKAGRLE